MFKLLILATLFLIGDLALSKQIPSIKYAQHIDIFNFIDNLSNWHSGITSTSYYEYFRAHHLLKSKDDQNLTIISNIRKKYYHPPSKQMLGARSDNEDLIALAFYKSKNYQDALIILKNILTKEDYLIYISALESFYSRAQSVLSKKHHIPSILPKLNESISDRKNCQFLDGASSFYHYESEIIKINIFIVWRPTQDDDSAFILDDFIIVKVKDEKINDFSKNIATLSSIIIHEIMHYLAMGLPQHINKYLELEIKKDKALSKYLRNVSFFHRRAFSCNHWATTLYETYLS